MVRGRPAHTLKGLARQFGPDAISASSEEQNRSNEVRYRSAVTLREVARQLRHTTGEESLGVGRSRDRVEGIRDAVEQINACLLRQTAARGEAAIFLEQVIEGRRSRQDGMQKLGGTMREFLTRNGTLREDANQFPVS